MANNRQSLSEQSQRRGNLVLLIIGLVLLLLFVLALCQMPSRKPASQQRTDEIDIDIGGRSLGQTDDDDITPFHVDPGNGQLIVRPSSVSMNSVVGKEGEVEITLKAENANILLKSKTLLTEEDNIFKLSGSCMEKGKDILELNEECTILVKWLSAEPRQLKNTLQIEWREDNDRVTLEEKTRVPIDVQVMDSNPCVICKCDEKSKHPEPIPEMVMPLDGSDPIPVEKGPNGPTVVIDGVEYPVPEDGAPIIDPKTGKVIAIPQPKFAPLNLKNELMGTVADNREVLDFDGKVIGRLLGDDTIVNEQLEVLGKAIPVVEVITESGDVIGRVKVDLESKSIQVVELGDETKVIGRPRIDGQVVDAEGKHLAYLTPWGLVMSFNGDILGGIVRSPAAKKTMIVLNEKSQAVGHMRPMGLAVTKKGELIGGVVPSGVVVGGGCQSHGVVTANGQVFNSFKQHVGHVLLDKAVVDVQGNELGSVVRQGLVIDSKGGIIGFINSEGKAVDAKGAMIGCVNPDGSVFAKEKFVGAIMPEGRVIKDGCDQVGSVYPNAKVISLDLQDLGNVLPNGTAVDGKKQLGWVTPWGTAIAQDCQLLGLISLNGSVVSTNGSFLGCLTRDKKVQNVKGDIIGMITPTGIQMNEKNQIIGRVGLDGHIISGKGEIVGCVNSSQNAMVISNSTRGVVIDENGFPTGWSFVAGKTYDTTGAWMGDVNFNGWVIGEKHQLVGVVPFSGSVFSDRGEIVGQYNQMSGSVVDRAGQSIGRVLPGMTVINGNATEILGVLIPEETVYVDLQGKILGTLRTDGVLINQGQEIPAKILANGTMVDEKGKILGGRLPTGPVLNTAGKYIGSATRNGDFLDESGIKAGHVLANGLVVSEQKQVLGMVFPSLSTAVGIDGWLGSLNPQLIEEVDKVSYQGQIMDPKGNLLGKISAAGQILGLDQSIKGSLIPIAPFINLKGDLMGWTNFKGEVNGPEGRAVANILPSGLALSPSQQLQGMIIKPTAVVGTQGEYLGHTTANGRLLSEKGEVLAIVGLSRFVYDTQGVLLGQLLPPGVAVDAENNLIGWTRYDGQIEDGAKVIGQVGLDRHVFDENGQMIGVYVPLGMVEFSNNNQSSGLVNERGIVQNVGGFEIASTTTFPFVSNKGELTGRLIEKTPFTIPLNTSKAEGIMSNDGKVYGLISRTEAGTAMTNTYTVGSAGLVDGKISTLGSAISTTLGLLGQVYPDGGIYNAQKQVAASTGMGLVFSLAGELVGGIFEPGIIVDKKGSIVAKTGATSAVMSGNKQIGSKMAFTSALTSTNQWIGNLMPRGASVDGMGNPLGIIALDGAVTNVSGNFVGRVLPDGSIAGVPQRSVYNTMPYVGHTYAQGLPLGLKKEILGRAGAMGEVLNKNNQVVGHIRDEESIWSEEKKPVGLIIPFISAIDFNGKVIGTLSSEGNVVSYEGENIGRVATNRAVKGSGEFSILGRLVPEDLIVNNCKIVGQTAYDGRVVNGQGSVVGRILRDYRVVDSQGNEVGYIPKKGPVTTEKTGTYIGRILPDGIMVDLNGIEVACSDMEGKLIDLKTGEEYIDLSTGEGAHVITRGLIFNKDGTLSDIWVSPEGIGYKPDGTAEIRLLGDGKNTIVDYKTNEVRDDLVVMSPKEMEILWDPNNPDKVMGFLKPDGKLFDKELNYLGQVDGDRLIAPDGREIPWNGTTVPSIGKKYYFKDCTLFDFSNNQVASLNPDGKLYDTSGRLFGSINANGEIKAPSGQPIDRIMGYLNLQECGMSPEALAGGKGRGMSDERKICIGKKCYVLAADGTLIDPDTGIVGGRYDQKLGRIFDLNNQVVDAKTGRPPVEKPKPPKIDAGQLEDIQQKLAQKRQNMRQKLGGTPLVMSAEMQARYKPKKDRDWASIGINKESVSSWPVDMTHVILQGRSIPAVLARSIDSRFADSPALAIVDTNIYAEEGRNILIPAGSQLIGSYAGESATQDGVAKINISWERLIRPDGVAFNLNGSPSADVMGRGGISAFLDEQLVSKYGTAIAGTLAQSAVAYMMATNEDANMSDSGNSSQSNRSQAANDSRKAFIEKFGEIVDDWIAHGQAVPPIVYVPIGTRLNVILKQDLWLRSSDDDEEAINDEYGEPPTAAQRPDMPSWEQNRKQQLEEMPDKGRNTKKDATTNSTQNTQTQVQKEAQSMATPIYDESDHMQENLENRVVEPVTAPQTPPLF